MQSLVFKELPWGLCSYSLFISCLSPALPTLFFFPWGKRTHAVKLSYVVSIYFITETAPNQKQISFKKKKMYASARLGGCVRNHRLHAKTDWVTVTSPTGLLKPVLKPWFCSLCVFEAADSMLGCVGGSESEQSFESRCSVGLNRCSPTGKRTTIHNYTGYKNVVLCAALWAFFLKIRPKWTI